MVRISASSLWITLLAALLLLSLEAGCTSSSDTKTGVPTPNSSPIPTLVQHVHTYIPSEYGNGYIIQAPNAALQDNCLILSMAHEAGHTVTITDNKGTNTWVLTKSVTNNGLTTSIYKVLGVAAGTQIITVTFDVPLVNVQFMLDEFYNVATSAADDGQSGSASESAPSVSAGTITTTADGDLIYNYAIAEG